MFDILSIPKGGKGTSLGRSRSKTEPAFADAAAALIA